MIPIAFDEENTVIQAPACVTPEQCDPLPAYVGHANSLEFGAVPVIISCWKLTTGELEQIQATGRVWLTVMGKLQPMVCLAGVSPFLGEGLPRVG